MRRIRILAGAVLFGAIAVTAAEAQTSVSVHCVPQRPDNLAARTSPYDSVMVMVGNRHAMLCYGRPSVRDRVIFGELIPYGKLWRTGANEPTILHIPFAASIAGVNVAPGSYSIYTVPGQSEWEVVVNRSIKQWGHEGSYTDEVKAQEVGRGRVKSEAIATPVELFTIRSESAGANTTNLVLEWEKTRVRIPVVARN